MRHRPGRLLATAALLLASCSTPGGQAVQAPRLTPITQQPHTAETTPGTATTTTTPSLTFVPRPSAGAPMPAVSAWVEAAPPADESDFHSAARDGAATPLGADIAFVTPLEESRCMTDAGTLSCLIDLAAPLPQPADSYGKWVPGWVDFDGMSVRVGSSHGDPGPFARGDGPILEYGHSLRFGDYLCRSDPGGLVCVNFAHQSGVRMGSAGVEPFGCLHPDTEAGTGEKFTC